MTEARAHFFGSSWRTYFHVTHRDNLPKIRDTGLLISRSRRASKRVWVAELLMVPWAIRHVSESHGWCLSDLVILRVTLPRTLLTTHRTGVHYLNFDVPPENIGAIQVFSACQY